MKYIFAILITTQLLIFSFSNLVCSDTEIYVLDDSEAEICIPKTNEIENCMYYNRSDPSKCHTCFSNSNTTGSENLYTQCDCTGYPFISTDENGKKICTKEIENCQIYNSQEPSKCHTCIRNAIPLGFSPSISSCDCSGKPYIVQDSKRNQYCVASVIENCEIYEIDTDGTKCETCKTGAVISGISPSISSCDCQGKPFEQGIDNNYNGICIEEEIENCEYYSSSNPGKCHSCIQGSIRTELTGNISRCSCDNKIIVNHHEGGQMCIYDFVFIENCAVYNKHSLGNCVQCNTGFEPSKGSSPLITQCTCQGDNTIKQDQNGNHICISNTHIIIGCQKYNNNNGKCYQCLGGLYAVGEEGQYSRCSETDPSFVCLSPRTVQIDEQGNNVCVKVITGCERYSSSDKSICHTCVTGLVGEGEENLFSDCNCPENKFKVLNENGNLICVNQEVKGCERYLNLDNSKCYHCAQNTVPVGIENTYTECTPCDEFVGVDENGVKICLKRIDGCKNYFSQDSSYCHTCYDSYTGNASQACLCEEGKVSVELDNGEQTCIEESEGIQNCLVYSASSDATRCYRCLDGIEGVGEEGFYRECNCESPMRLGLQRSGEQICVYGIQMCRYYNYIDSCEECAEGVGQPQQDGGVCFCEEEKQKKDEEGNDICVYSVVENCSFYERADRCGGCEEGYEMNGESRLCESSSSSEGILLAFWSGFVGFIIILLL